jgi:hypothetical protein
LRLLHGYNFRLAVNQQQPPTPRERSEITQQSYSFLNGTTGSISVARRPGIVQPDSVAADMMAATAKGTLGS